MNRSRRRAALLIVLLTAVVNLPLLHSWWEEQRVRTSGTEVSATVVDDRVVGGDEFWVSFTFPEDVDPDQRTRTAQVDEEAYDDAVASGEITVRVADDDPSAFLAEGEVRSIVPVVMTLVADVFLVLVALLLWRSGGRRRAGLRALALEDVTRCAPATLLERIGGEDYLIRGEVVEVGEGSVTLDLGNRAVVVLLDGHQNPVGHQQPAQVRARLIS